MAFSITNIKRIQHIVQCVIALICFTLLTSTLIFAQGTRGTIRGIVTDPNGAVVAGANVQLIEPAKQNVGRTIQTNNEGVYQFVEVEPATYTILITASGFSEARLDSVKVEPNRNLQLDAQLNIGGGTTEVTVSAAQELIDRQTPTLGTTVDRERVVDLPLNGRNVLQLALLQPGITPASQGNGVFGDGLGIRANGQRGVSNNVTLDGGNNNELAIGGATVPAPRPDAVQEFRLLSSNSEAEFGRNTGAIINTVVRSGTNQYHGNARIFYRPTFLSAARFFDQNDPTDRPLSGPGDFRRRFERKDIGGNIGGPINLPRFAQGGRSTYSGKDRLFFFFDYERRAQLLGDSRTVTGLPSAAELGGLFTRDAADPLLDPANRFQPFPIVSTSGSTIRQQIPTSRFSPIANFYTGFLPIPNAIGQSTVAANSIANNHYVTSRVDYNVTQNQVVNFSYNYFRGRTLSPFAFGGASVPGFGSRGNNDSANYVARHTYVITPNIVNALLLAYSRNNQPGVVPEQTGLQPTSIGFATNAFVSDPGNSGAPFIRLLDRGITLGNSIQGPQTRVSENFQIQDSVSYVAGNHRFKFGFDGTQYRQDQAFLFINQGIFSFSGTNGGNTTGDDFADLLIGNTPIAQQFGAAGLRDYRQKAGSLFAQDTYRLSDTTTLSLGLRYEYFAPLTDTRNRVAYYRAGATSQLLTSGQLRDGQGRVITIPAGRRAPVGLVFPGDPDPVLGGTVPDGGIAKDLNNFAPRVGIAYSPKSSSGFRRTLLGENGTVIRAGFGVFYDQIIGDTALQQLSAPGFGGTNAFFFPGGGTLADPFAPDPFGRQTQIPNPFLAGTTISAPLNQFSQPIDPRLRTPYTYQYNLTVERGFGKDYVAQLSYVGNASRKQFARLQINPSLGTFFAPNRTLPAATASNANARRLNDDVRTGLNMLVSQGNSNYNALQANLQKRLSDDGLLFQAAYTYSKSITDSDTQRDSLDLIDRRAGRSLSSQDTPHRFVVSTLYELPFAKKSNGFTKYLLGGFTLGGIYTLQSGNPFSVGGNFDTTGTAGILSFAGLGSEPFRAVNNPQGNNNLAFNPGAFNANFGNPNPPANSGLTPFVLARDFRRGTSGANQFRVNNGINNFDLILIKRTRFTESTNLELRFEAFNALNHTQFGPSGETTNTTGIDLNLFQAGRLNPSFGQFIQTREARIIQLGARFSF